MAKLWTRMSSIYGADRWQRAYGAEPAESWREVLGRLTLDDIARGIGRAERDDSHRLPTMGQFLTMCYEYPAGQVPPQARQQRLPDVRTLSERTAVGRRWMAFWQLEGLVPRTLSDEEIHDRLAGADVEEMRRQVKRGCERIAAEHSR